MTRMFFASSGKPYRTSSDSMWPLRAADGRTFASHKDTRMTRNDVIDLYAATFNQPRAGILHPKGAGAHARRRTRTALIKVLVDHYLQVSGTHVAGSAHKVIANSLDIEQSAVRQALGELPILKKMDPEFARVVDDLEKIVFDKLAMSRCTA